MSRHSQSISCSHFLSDTGLKTFRLPSTLFRLPSNPPQRHPVTFHPLPRRDSACLGFEIMVSRRAKNKMSTIHAPLRRLSGFQATIDTGITQLGTILAILKQLSSPQATIDTGVKQLPVLWRLQLSTLDDCANSPETSRTHVTPKRAPKSISKNSIHASRSSRTRSSSAVETPKSLSGSKRT
jgi:hypothetical protein